MKESLLLSVFMQAAIFLVVAALFVPLLKRIKIPGVLGYLIAGILLGPQGLGQLADHFKVLQYVTLRNTEDVKILSELGIVFLLFVIGLELTPQKLWKMRNLVFGLGTVQVVLSAMVIGSVAYAWGNSVQAAILLGLGLSLSSTAIITQWLHERKLFNTHAGQTSLGILLLQDLAVIPILILITVFTTDMGDGIAPYIGMLVLKMVIAVSAIIVIGKWFVKPVFFFSNKYGGSEVFIALSMLVIVVSASIAGLAGLSLALGAFIGGLLLAETQYSHEISMLVVPFKGMLLGIFFMAFGMSIDIYFITEKPFLLVCSAAGLIVLKAGILYGLCRLWKIPKPAAAECAILLPQAGEFGLLVVGSAMTAGLLAEDVGQFMFLTVGLTMLVTPVMTPLSARVSAFLRDQGRENPDYKPASGPEGDVSGHIIILGYGRMGETISEILATQGIPSIIFENNVEQLRVGQDLDVSVYYGDASKKSTIVAAKVESAAAVVITIDNAYCILRAVDNIRGLNKHIPIIVRVHKLSEVAGLEKYENVHVVPEYLSASTILAEKALEHSGYLSEEARVIAQNESADMEK
ncbi:MAG: cation:proton antiporter [Alphaproteobacteria bacterium]|jgi:CPA2 family monovalent cation:H+ antiporter-2|nr:cation:proton antiporter [Alphaproteobacteria bacterium]MDP7221903.1 cation:proton antiporter [Alphaproteobacteria bacterium]